MSFGLSLPKSINDVKNFLDGIYYENICPDFSSIAVDATPAVTIKSLFVVDASLNKVVSEWFDEVTIDSIGEVVWDYGITFFSKAVTN